MAIIRKKELSMLSKEELLKKLRDLELELIKQRNIKQVGQGVKIKTREIKRTIARIKTILNLKYKYKI
ncbi:MAG: 50S ribosomal protein L29 [Candidatus Pacearchaeota archaeon]